MTGYNAVINVNWCFQLESNVNGREKYAEGEEGTKVHIYIYIYIYIYIVREGE